MLLRALVVWLVLLLVEAVHGVLRMLWLVPLVGDLAARQIGVPVGALLILLIARATIGWIGACTGRQLLRVGVLWVVAMLGAEVVLGKFVFGFGWDRIVEDFDPRRGGLLAFGMLLLGASPWLTHRWRTGRT